MRGRGIEVLLARHDIENEDAMAYLEGRLRRIGVIRALEEAGFEPGDEIEIGGVTFELDPAEGGPESRRRERRRRAGPNKLPAMRRIVVKLGSSVVAGSDGELRMDVLAGLADELAAAHAAGEEAIVVTSGAIARGMRVMELPQRPSSIGELQAASAVGQGKLYRVYDELLRERGVTSAQVLLTFFDMSARTHYLNARQTLTTLLYWRVLPVINENDTTATDEISFGDNDFLAAQVAVLVGADELVLLTDIDGLYTADPRLHPDARIVPRGGQLRGARASSRSVTRPRRWARAACARRSSRPRWRRRRGSRRRSATGSVPARSPPCSRVSPWAPASRPARPATTASSCG